jgi:hypothetical protein
VFFAAKFDISDFRHCALVSLLGFI